MNQNLKTGFRTFYRLAPRWFTEEGTLCAAAERAAYLASLGVDGVVLADDGQTWTESEKNVLQGALSDAGLSLSWEDTTSEAMERLHHRCRRPNWEAVPYDPGEMKDILLQGQREANPVIYFENENLPRSVSEMGNDGLYRRESASMLAVVLLTLRGDAVLYQGEEVGMTNPSFSLEELRCSEAADWLRTPDAQRRSREELEAKIGRFTCLNARTVPDFDEPEGQEILIWYKKLLSFRKTSKIIRLGDISPILPEHRRALLYTRAYEGEQLTVFANLSGYAAEYPPELESGSLIFHNYEGQMNFPGILRPFEVKIFTSHSLL